MNDSTTENPKDKNIRLEGSHAPQSFDAMVITIYAIFLKASY